GSSTVGGEYGSLVRRDHVRRRPDVIVFFLDDFRTDESIPMTRHGPDESRIARIVAERAPDRANRLTQRAVGDDDVAPDVVEDLSSMHRLVPMFDQKDEQVEVARDERLLDASANEHAPFWREREIAEAITGHSVTRRGGSLWE